MRGPGRGSPIVRQLFTARQVYVRDGGSSHYVALSRRMQIGVALGVAFAIAWLAIASYGFIAKHLETLEQQRELVRLEAVARRLHAVAEEARASEALRATAQRVPQLVAELANAKAGRERALGLADAASGEAQDLRRELALAEERIDSLELALENVPVSSAWPAVPPFEFGGGAPGPLNNQASAARVLGERVRAAEAEVEQLGAERDRLEDLLMRRVAEVEARAVEIEELRAELEDAEAEIARLRGELDLARAAQEAAARRSDE